MSQDDALAKDKVKLAELLRLAKEPANKNDTKLTAKLKNFHYAKQHRPISNAFGFRQLTRMIEQRTKE